MSTEVGSSSDIPRTTTLGAATLPPAPKSWWSTRAMRWHPSGASRFRSSRSMTCCSGPQSFKQDWDGSRLCVGGQSAGGNLCAAAARLALENGGPQIKLQVLHYPPLDLVTSTKDKHAAGGRTAFFRPRMGDIIDTAYIPDPKQRRN